MLVKQVKGEMESMRGQYQGMVSELQAKLRWYAENQVRVNSGVLGLPAPIQFKWAVLSLFTFHVACGALVMCS